jgi:hypothetical protein
MTVALLVSEMIQIEIEGVSFNTGTNANEHSRFAGRLLVNTGLALRRSKSEHGQRAMDRSHLVLQRRWNGVRAGPGELAVLQTHPQLCGAETERRALPQSWCGLLSCSLAHLVMARTWYPSGARGRRRSLRARSE